MNTGSVLQGGHGPSPAGRGRSHDGCAVGGHGITATAHYIGHHTEATTNHGGLK